MTALPGPLQTLAEQQEGLLSRRQLRRGGVTNARIRWEIGRRWQLVLPGVVAIFTGRLDASQRLVAGSLYAGPDALLSGPVGPTARSHAPWVNTYPLLTFLVPEHKTNRRSGFVTVRRTQRPDLRPVTFGGVAVASAARCVADAARTCRREEDARALTISALQRRVTSEDHLYAELLAGPVRFSAAVRAGITGFQAGDPEAFVRRVERAYLALRRRGGRPDVVATDRHHHDLT
jgi:hypothetical protein